MVKKEDKSRSGLVKFYIDTDKLIFTVDFIDKKIIII